VPDPLVDILSLQTINLSGNQLTAIPAFTENPQIQAVNVSGNNLEFGTLEANAGLLAPGITFTYTNQAELGQTSDLQIDVGSPYSYTAATQGTNTYQWRRNGQSIAGANAKTYNVASLGRGDIGEYVCEINNSLFPALTLKTAKQKITVIAKLSGKLFASSGQPASKGRMTLLKINPKGKYDTTAVQNIQPDGSYLLQKIVLDDYQLVGFVDTLSYKGALPTYFENSIFWEEAKTIAVNSNLNNLSITSNYKPTNVPKGTGMISGYIEEIIKKPGGKIQDAGRVTGAGASVRRVEHVARPMEEKLTLVAYVFSDENGEFALPNLQKGEYRLNIQYPGYPMDETSFVTIPIGDGLESQVRVAAVIDGDKISVSKLVVTGVWEEENYQVTVSPNPSASFVQFKFNNESLTRKVQFLDATGKQVLNLSATEKDKEVDVRTFGNGIYLIRIFDQMQLKKVVRLSIETSK